MVFILITEFLVSTLIVPQGKCLTCIILVPADLLGFLLTFFFGLLKAHSM